MHFGNIDISLLTVYFLNSLHGSFEYLLVLGIYLVLLHLYVSYGLAGLDEAPESSGHVVVHTLLVDIVNQDQGVGEILSRELQKVNVAV